MTTKIEGKVVFGIDIGGTTVKCSCFNEDGEMLYSDEIKTRTENNGEFILSDIKEHIDELLGRFSVSRDQVIGIGYGVPGPVQEDGTVNGCVNLGWGVKDVKKESEELNGFPSAVGNDANVAALGEFWKGAGKGTRSMVLITIGTGLGCGVIINGRIVYGAHGAGGELGHIPLVTDCDVICNCGKKGCLELAAAATGIIRRAKKNLAESDAPSLLRGKETIMAKDVIDAAREGDALALEAIDYSSDYTGRGLAVAAGVVDPDVYVIGGGVSKAGDFYLDRIRNAYKKYVFYASRPTPILAASLGNSAGMYGAAKLVLDSLKQ